ncbi:MAG: hypothetical protein IPK61_07860 [Saprospiraceae bacterium]|nr:hypothetical protein [Saprospiraceae bacterium]
MKTKNMVFSQLPSAVRCNTDRNRMTFKEILEIKPNGFYENVENVIVNSFQRYSNDEKKYIAYPDLELFCTECNGQRNFVREMYPYTIGDPEIEIDYPYAYLLDYLCSNCKSELKYFALKLTKLVKLKMLMF